MLNLIQSGDRDAAIVSALETAMILISEQEIAIAKLEKKVDGLESDLGHHISGVEVDE